MLARRTGSFALLLAVAALLFPCGGEAGPASDIKVWPIFYRASDPETQETRTEILWPIYVRHRTATYAANQILSFPQRYPTRYPRQFYLLWPLSGVRTGHGHDTWFFPFLWSGAEANGRRCHLALFPAFYYGRRDDKRTLNIALLQHNSWSKTPSSSSRLHALWPILWTDSSSTYSGRDACHGLLPLIWLSYHKSDSPQNRSESHSGGVLLLNWWHRYEYHVPTLKCTSASDGLFPVFYRSNDDTSAVSEQSTKTNHSDAFWLIPYWHWHRRERASTGRTTAESLHVFFPLWWAWASEDNKEAYAGRWLFPFWWRSSESRGGEVVKSTNFVVPLGAHFFKKDEYETHNLLGPMFNRTENKAKEYVRYDAFFPLFSATTGKRRSGGHVFPFAGWGSESGRYSNLWYLFPLGWRCESQEGKPYRVGAPNLWALHEMERRPFTNVADCPNAGPRRNVAFYPFAWSRRQADRQTSGLTPFWWGTTRRSGRNVSTETWLPLLLGRRATTVRDGKPTYARQDSLLSILAWGKGERFKLRRVFPLFSYGDCYGRRYVRALLPPFSYETSRDRYQPKVGRSSKLSIPFRFLPWFGSRTSERGLEYSTRKSWFFPFYKHTAERAPDRDVKKLSILWPLWNAEWENGEKRVRALGGLTSRYERDANGFVEQRILYRLFTRRTRSWLSEHELMPFYSQQSIEDGDSYRKFLGGLVGGETRGGRTYLRLLYLPVPMGKADTPGKRARAKRQAKHAALALNYLRHGRHDRAAIEFKLAGNARNGDREFQLATGEAYLKARPEAVSKELRSTIPSSLESLASKRGHSDIMAVRQKLRELAIQHFERAIRLGADEADTLREIARAHRDLWQYETALENLTKSDQLRPRFATAMDRLAVLAEVRGVGLVSFCPHARRPRPPRMPAEDAGRKWRKLLSEIRKRYPESPTLILCEAETAEGLQYGNGLWGRYRHRPARGALSESTVLALALYERGAQMRPGPEEKLWLAKHPAPRTPNSGPAPESAWPDRKKPVSPWSICAARGIMILSRQASLLMGQKKLDKAEARLARIQKLMGRVCQDCDATDYTDDASRALGDAMGCLERLYVKKRNRPLTYLATAEKWAKPLCPRHKKIVERLATGVRIELQYLKRWRISPVAGCDFPAMTYSGKFFDRYVNLDAILGRPDRCTVAAECVLVSPDERRAVLRLGFDESLAAELNGETIFRKRLRRVAVRDEFVVPITLRKGENRLRLLVADNTLGYGFFARLSDERGDFMEDVTCKE